GPGDHVQVPRRVEHRNGGRGRHRGGHGRPRRAGHRAPARGRARGRGRGAPPAAPPAGAGAAPPAARRFLPHARAAARRDGTAARRSPLAAWTEPRTLLIGLFVLCMAFTEGTSTACLSLAVIGAYHTAAVLGTLTFAVFLAAMTTGRWFGPAF